MSDVYYNDPIMRSLYILRIENGMAGLLYAN